MLLCDKVTKKVESDYYDKCQLMYETGLAEGKLHRNRDSDMYFIVVAMMVPRRRRIHGKRLSLLSLVKIMARKILEGWKA